MDKKIKRVILQIETSRAWGRGLLNGIARYSRLQGSWVSYRIADFYSFDRPLVRKQEFVELILLKKWGADGIITRDTVHLQEIAKTGIPIIEANDSQAMPGIPRVCSDYAATGNMAAEYFIDKGFRNFAYCGFDDVYWSRQRLASFTQSVQATGFDVFVYEQPTSKLKRMWDKEPDIIADWLKSLPKPVGIMTCCDLRSQHIIEAARIAQIKVPEEIAVLGVDNDELLCDMSSPTLSSIAMNTEVGGYKVAELLDKLMTGKPVEETTIVVNPTRVITRQSTDILAMDDKNVAEAIRFIRYNSKKPIQVSDVVSAAGISRRSLEKRFRKLLGRSVLDEIRRVRVSIFAQLLTETDLSISEIAKHLGCSSNENVGRYFYHETGLRPSEYRQKYGFRGSEYIG